jgi:hypothetical protein
MKNWGKVLCIVLIATGCKKAFTPPEVSSVNNRYLVIEGAVNSGNDSTFIKISRTQKIDSVSSVNPEVNANVSVESDANSNYKLTEIAAGKYATGPLSLDGTHKYRLRIKTTDNKEYVSDFVAVKNAPPIDSVGFIAQGTGVQIYVNTHDPANATHYYRWEYNEDWQFHSTYISAYKSNLAQRKVSEQVYNCFGKDASGTVVIASSAKLAQDVIYQAPVTTIPSTSEKIERKYSILVKQYALTSDAYSFWENLQKNTEKIGSIFDALPSENQSNFHCITNPNELVVGYLSVGSTTSKRIFITTDQLLKSYSPIYPSECKIDTAYYSPLHFGWISSSALTPDNSPYMPILALFPFPNVLGVPYGYSYSTKICVDCTIRGTTTQPAFWK